MKKIIVFLILNTSFLIAGSSHQIGASFSTASGMGLNYKYYPGANFHFQISGFPYYTGEEIPDKMNAYFNVGTQINYDLFRQNRERYFLAFAYSYWSVIDNDYSVVVINDVPNRTNNYNSQSINNYFFGLGYEYIYLKTISISFDLGIQYQISSGSIAPGWIDLNQNGNYYIGPGAGLTLRYVL